MDTQLSNKLSNRGTGAGGSNTISGRKFEDKTSMTSFLDMKGFKPYCFRHEKWHFEMTVIDTKKISRVSQGNFKKYMKKVYNIDGIYKNPDDAYIIEDNGKIIVKILEKKEQNVEGSVEEKLWTAGYIKKTYQKMMGPNVIIEYAYCVSDFLKKKLTSDVKKYQHLNEMFLEDGIKVFFGDDENCFEQIYNWVCE